MLCHRLVCRQHKILDQLRRVVSLMRVNRQRLAVFIQFDLAFRKIKIHRAALFSLLPKHLRKLRHLCKHRRFVAVCFPKGFVAVQNFLHLRIAHALVHTDHRFHNLIIADISALVHFHQARQCQSVFPGI